MTICFVTPEFITEKKNFDGGLSNYLFRVALSLQHMGHTAIIVVASDVTEVFFYEKIEVHRVKVPFTLSPYYIQCCLQSFILNNYIRSLVLKKIIDIIQYSNYTFTSLYRILTIPTVCRISSYEKYLDEYYNQTDLNNESIKKYELEKFCLLSTDAVFGPSTIIANAIKNDLKIDSIEIIETPFYNDVKQTDEFVYSENLQNCKYFLFFGTIGILKGIKTIAAIIDELLEKNPNFLFVFVGKQTDIEGQTAMEYVRCMAPMHFNRIKHFGALNHDQLYPIISHAEICVFPSRIDNFPNCCIEAMAHKKIVIGTKNTGFDQLITHGVNGFLCERDNPLALLQTIENVLQLRSTEKEIIENNAYARIQLLTPERVVTQLVDFYEATIKRFDIQKATKCSFQTQMDVQQILFDSMLQQKRYNESVIKAKDTIIQKKEESFNEIVHSKTYRLGNIFLSPFRKIMNIKF